MPLDITSADGLQELVSDAARAPQADVRILEINALCKIAGAPELAAGFIADQSVTVEKVRAKILERRVKADDIELQTGFLPLAASSGDGRLTTAVKKLLARRNKAAK